MSHNIILNEGDAITEDAIRTILGRSAVSGYVEQNTLGITYHEDDTVDVEPGEVHILHNRQDITIETDAFSGHGLVANEENTLWIVVDPTAATDDEAVSLVSNATGVAPSDPSIEIATVDTNKAPQDNTAVQLSNRGTAAALDGEDINPRSIGEGQRVLSVLAELVDADSVDAASGSIGALESDSGAFGDVSAASAAFESVSADAVGEFARTQYVDPSVDDLGAELNDLLDKVPQGGVIKVPAVEYAGPQTPVTVTKPFVTICSEWVPGRDQWYNAGPKIIDESGDRPFLTLDEFTTLEGLIIDRTPAPNDGGAAILVHKASVIEGVIGERIDGAVIDLRCEGVLSPDNVDNSIVHNVSGHYCNSDVVRVSKTPEAVYNLNALDIQVTTAKECEGWAVNFEAGFGNRATVNHAAGGLGAIHFGGSDSSGFVHYAADGLDKTVRFTGQNNHVEMARLGTNEPMPEMQGTANTWRFIGENDVSSTDFYSSERFDIGGKSLGLSQGQGVVFTSADGGKHLLRVTNDGSITVTGV